MKKTVSINQSINEIFDLLSSKASKGTIVVRETLGRFTLAVAGISVYDRAEYMADRKKARPRTRYVFYPQVGDHERLGSVAIYTLEAIPLCLSLRGRRSLFGREIDFANVEQGRSTFVDVKFAA